jgi:hypothetical protein
MYDFEELSVDAEVPLIGGQVRRLREDLFDQLDRRTEAQEATRELLIGTLLRMARKVYWCFFRQLWDDDYDRIARIDAECELIHRTIMLLRKTLEAKRDLTDKLERTRRKLVREFGEEYDAAQQVAMNIRTTTSQIKALEAELREIIMTKSTDVLDVPNGASINLGGAVVLLLDPAWSWIAKDGQMVDALPGRDVPVHARLYEDLERALETLPRGSHGVDPGALDDDGVYDQAKANQREAERKAASESAGAGAGDPYQVPVEAVLCVSPMPLLPLRGGKMATRAPEEPQMFYPAAIDARRILTRLARWQQYGNERVALLVSASPSLAAEGLVTPMLKHELEALQVAEGNNKPEEIEEDDGWDMMRCPLHHIMLGGMAVRPTARVRKAQFCFQGHEVVSRFKSQLNAKALRGARSFFDATKLSIEDAQERQRQRSSGSSPDTPAPDTQPPDAKALAASFDTRCVLDKRPCVDITVGPVVGRVTDRSAVVLLESSRACHLEVLLVDQVTGVETSMSRRLRAGEPQVYAFDALEAGRPYEVRVVADQPFDPALRMSLEEEAEMESQLAGPLKPDPNVPPEARGVPNEKHQRDDILASLGLTQSITLARATTPGAGSGVVAVGTLSANKDPQVPPVAPLSVDQLQEVGVGSLRSTSDRAALCASLSTTRATFCTVDPPPLLRALRAEDMAARRVLVEKAGLTRPIALDTDLSPARERSAFRILAVGACRPVWSLRSSARDNVEANLGTAALGWTDAAQSIYESTDVAQGIALDRACVEEGHALLEAVADLLALPFGGVDLVVHVGGNVDLTYSLQESLALLSRAESAHDDGDTDLREGLLSQAQSTLADAYRLHWGGSSMRQTLAHGSHLFLSSPMVDILQATNCGSLRHLARDLSPFVTQHLLRSVHHLERSYQSALFEPEALRSHAHFFCDGRVCVFTLRPRMTYEQDEPGGQYYSLIDESQFLVLSRLLDYRGLPSSDDADRAAFRVAGTPTQHAAESHFELDPLRGSERQAICSLVLLTPLPLVRGDPDSDDHYFSSGRRGGGPAYTTNEVGRLLRIISDWMRAARPGMQGAARARARDAVVVGGGSSCGFRSVLEAYERGPHVNNPDLEARSATNPSTTSGFSHGEPDAKISQICCGPSVSAPDFEALAQKRKGSIHTQSSYLYNVVHSESSVQPHCGFVEISGLGADQQLRGGGTNLSSKMLHLSEARTLLVKSRLAAAECTPVVYESIWKNVQDTLVGFKDLTATGKKKKGEKETKEEKKAKKKEKKAKKGEVDVLGDLVKAIRKTLGAHRDIIHACHEELKKGAFGYMVRGGVVAQQTVSVLSEWVLEGIPDPERSLFLLPSVFVVGKVWADFRQEFGHPRADSTGFQRNDLQGVLAAENPMAADEVATTALVCNVGLMERLVGDVLEAAVLFEHFGYQCGLVD